MDVENEIARQGFSLVNFAGTATRQGVELSASLFLTSDLSLAASYTYLDASNGDGRPEERRPEHLARLDVNYAFDRKRGNLNLGAVYNGEMFDYSAIRKSGPNLFDITTVDYLLDDYVLLSAAASYELSPGFQLYGRVENALNENYQEVFGFETADLAAYVGLRFTYVEEATRAWAEGR
jgi:vitamin B12 transporter